ncbi:hypothetical protein J0A67_09945 [Algoriphagus aestuariicola]|uniref:Uncharacterized protein n=1 Tax=Algoriphagus aestuariicola TaxID=1852016 RepID=A0ABS3BQT1_9BACT|nr:hypothetical protein [Algoriphagus aestuariicola]MBN7801184.1 hypothetical protein [Algoriphagus aestuariicola]
MQYFIKPILLKNIEKEEYLMADFTFRHQNEATDSVTVNFSIEGDDLHKKIDSLVISSSSVAFATKRIELLFNEKSKRGYVSRYTTKVSLNDMRHLFGQGTWDYTIYNETLSNSFLPTPKSKKAISAINNNLFILM